MRVLLSRVLAGLGFAVQQASDAPEAERWLRHGTPDLVVVDHNLPGPNGLEFVAALRGRPGSAGVKVLMVSAEGSGAFLQHALSAGVDEYLFKPFTTDALISKIALLGLLTQA